MLGTFDIDRFKVINDVYGTQVGDSILVQLAAATAREVLGKGVCGRLGADVFAFCSFVTENVPPSSTRMFVVPL